MKILYFLLFIFFSMVVGCFALMLVAAYMLAGYYRRWKQRKLARLAHYQKRLFQIVSHLLAQTNELDQVSQYVSQDLSHKWSGELAKVCLDLVTVTDTLKVIETSVREEKIWDSERCIKSAVVVTHQLSGRLMKLKHEVKLLQGGP